MKLICFDMEGVLFDIPFNDDDKIEANTWSILFNELGIPHEHKRLKRMFTRGQFSSYMDWTNEACKVLKKYGLTKDLFVSVINSRPLMEGAKETLQKLKEYGHKTATITGSFKALAMRAKNVLDLDYVIAHCELIFNDKGKLEDWKLIPCDFEGKVVYLRRLLRKLDIKPTQTIYIGNGINDLAIFKEVLSIAFNASCEAVKKSADIVINEKDLRKILHYI